MRNRVPGRGGARPRPAPKQEEEEASSPPRPASNMVSLDEAEAGEEKAAEPVVDDIDVEDDAEDAPDDPFLEEEEEDDDDVSRPHRRRHRPGRGRLSAPTGHPCRRRRGA